jgi:hypothetical protein
MGAEQRLVRQRTFSRAAREPRGFGESAIMEREAAFSKFTNFDNLRDRPES